MIYKESLWTYISKYDKWNGKDRRKADNILEKIIIEE
jgi:hypothetical protein